jgi:hypothetical protein
VNELEVKLRSVAEAAAGRAQPPGATITLRRARRRRVTGAGATALLVVALVAGMVGVQQQLPHHPPAATPVAPGLGVQDAKTGWLPLTVGAIQFVTKDVQPDGHPVAPLVVVATGQRDGVAWRLVAYRSTDTTQGQPPMSTVCTLLEWAHNGWDVWCSPEATKTTVVRGSLLASNPRIVMVIGRAPAAATRVRLLPRDRPPVEVPTDAAGVAVPGRFYLALVPASADLEQVVALDGSGRQVGQAQGPGPLDVVITADPPTGKVAVVASAITRSRGRLRLLAYPTAQGFCLQLRSGGGSSCDPRGRPGLALEPQAECNLSDATPYGLVWGSAPLGTRLIRLELRSGWRKQAPATPAGVPFNRAFFLAELPAADGGLHVTALDRHGRTLTTWQLDYGCHPGP